MRTLQELCISKIVNNFDRHFLAFSKCEDAKFKRKFEFLQIVYSFQIASELYSLGLMKVNYLDFVVNKYLKVLDTKWFKDCQWKTVAAKFAEVGSNIQKINFHKSKDMPFQNVIHYMTNLEDMSFPYHCTDEILKEIAQFCHNITKIDIRESYRVTDEGIKSLCVKKDGKQLCNKLKEVYLGRIHVDEGVKCLIKNLRSLEVIDYYHFLKLLESLHENGLPSNDNIEPYNFTSVDLHFCLNYDHVFKICLSLCPHLKSLSCLITNNENFVDLLHSSVELETLYLKISFSDKVLNLNDLLNSKGKKLTSLSVNSYSRSPPYCSLSISTLSKSCPHLKHLNLIGVLFGDEDDSISMFQCLESSIFENVIYDSATVKSISLLLKHSPKLEHIGFMRSDLSSTDLKTNILKCCEHYPIKKVNLVYSGVDANFIKGILLSCPSLNCLILDGRLSSEESQEIFGLVNILPNNPKIWIDDEHDLSDFDDSNFTAADLDFSEDLDFT